MCFAYVSSPGVPTMRPRNLSGVGTVADAGRWSTSSVVIRGSWRYSLILAVYAESFGCWASIGAAATRARAEVATQRGSARGSNIGPPRGRHEAGWLTSYEPAASDVGRTRSGRASATYLSPMRILKKQGDVPRRSLWQRIKDVALTDVAVLARGGVSSGAPEKLQELLLQAEFRRPPPLQLVSGVEAR